MQNEPPNGNGWYEWKQHVLYQLRHQSEAHKEIDAKLDNIAMQVALLKVKASFWGAVAGVLPGAAAALYVLLR